jgi:hypothetical protein
MKTMLLGAIAAMGLAAGAARAETPLMAPIHQFIDNFNKGDQKTAAAAFAPTSLAIIDEVAPHVWVGPGALGDWARDLGAHDKSQGDTDQAVTLGQSTREIVSGDRGYVVVPATYTYKERGVAMREPAQMTYALQKGAGGWLITGWSWVGTTPTAAPAK